MDIALILNIIKKHKLLVMVGFLLGILSAFNTLYELGFDNFHFTLKKRSLTTYETKIDLMVNEPRFSVGRAGLIMTSTPDAYRRTVALAPIYSRLITSDRVIKAVERKTGPLRASVESVSEQDMPIIRITVVGSDPQYIVDTALQVTYAFSEYLKSSQEMHDIPPEDRVFISRLVEPSPPVPLQSRAKEFAALAFLAPLLIAIMLAFILENIKKGSLSLDKADHVSDSIRTLHTNVSSKQTGE